MILPHPFLHFYSNMNELGGMEFILDPLVTDACKTQLLLRLGWSHGGLVLMEVLKPTEVYYFSLVTVYIRIILLPGVHISEFLCISFEFYLGASQ